MRQRRLGGSGLRVSRMGLGTMSWGEATDADEAASQLVAFVDAGGTLVDTADVYCDGESERILGDLLGDVVPVLLPLRPEVVSPGDVLVASGLAQLVVVGMRAGRTPSRVCSTGA